MEAMFVFIAGVVFVIYLEVNKMRRLLAAMQELLATKLKDDAEEPKPRKFPCDD